MAKLDFESRAILRLRYGFGERPAVGLTQCQVAARLGRCERTVRNRERQALLTLRDILDPDDLAAAA